jgi:hypothetical protein
MNIWIKKKDKTEVSGKLKMTLRTSFLNTKTFSRIEKTQAFNPKFLKMLPNNKYILGSKHLLAEIQRRA